VSDTRQRLIEDAVEKLSAKGPRPSPKNALMLGVIAGVCARNPPAKELLDAKKSEIYGFYVREIIGSRSPLPAHVANGLHDFFVSFTTKDDIEKEIVPSLEKALLRAPEIVLNDLVSPLFRSLSDTVDLSTVLKKSLLKPLLSNIKSTNATIRLGALNTFKAAVLKCHDPDVISQIADEVLAPLKTGKLSSVEQRVCHAEMLAALPISKTSYPILAPALSAVAGKEANETALAAETLALLKYLEWGVQEGMPFDKSVVDAFVKGISDKRPPFRKLWVLHLGRLFWSTSDGEILKSNFSILAESAMPVLLEIWNDVTTNPLGAAQSGLVTAAYVITAVSLDRLPSITSPKVETALKKARVTQQALTVEPKPSFLLNQRIYGKLTNEDDFTWFIRALTSLFPYILNCDPTSETAISWSQAIIFCICSSTNHPSSRRDAALALSSLYVQNPGPVARVIIAGIWRWRHSIEQGEKDSAASISRSDVQNLHLVIKSICLPSTDVARLGVEVEESVKESQMVSLLVLARPQLLPGVNWIDLCLRIGIDPGKLARASEESLITQILDSTSFNETVSRHSFHI
jgi:hypothetical protein